MRDHRTCSSSDKIYQSQWYNALEPLIGCDKALVQNRVQFDDRRCDLINLLIVYTLTLSDRFLLRIFPVSTSSASS